MRICILCEESKVLQAREKMKNEVRLSKRIEKYFKK